MFQIFIYVINVRKLLKSILLCDSYEIDFEFGPQYHLIKFDGPLVNI